MDATRQPILRTSRIVLSNVSEGSILRPVLPEDTINFVNNNNVTNGNVQRHKVIKLQGSPPF